MAARRNEAGSASNTTETVAGSTAAGSGVESGSAGRATGAGAGVDVGMDIGQAEAYTVQLKRLVAGELSLTEFMAWDAANDAARRHGGGGDHDGELRHTASTLLARLARNAEDNDHERAKLGNLALANAISNADALSKINLSERERTVRHSDVAADHLWNLSEESLVLSEILRSNTFKDAVAGAVSAALAEALTKKSA